MRKRFLVFVAAAALVPVAVAGYVTADVAMRSRVALDNNAAAAAAAAENRLAADSAERRELLLRLSLLAPVAEGVQEAARAGVAPSPEAAVRLREAGRAVLPQRFPELFALATAAGVRVVVTEGEAREEPADRFPLAAAALGGQSTETVAPYGGTLYRFWAVPVGVADGALIVGDRLVDATALRLREDARAQVSFVRGGVVNASTLPLDDRAMALQAAEAPGAAMRSGRLGTRLPGLGFLDSVLPLGVPGEAWISLARDIGGGASVVVSLSTEPELGWLAPTQFLSLGLALALLMGGLLWMQLLYRPVVSQVRSVAAHLARLRAEPGVRLGTRGFSAPFIELVHEVDHFAADGRAAAGRETAAGGAPARQQTPAPVRAKPAEELPLGPVEPAHTGENEAALAAFPFADDPAVRGSAEQSPSDAAAASLFDDAFGAPPPGAAAARADEPAQAPVAAAAARGEPAEATPQLAAVASAVGAARAAVAAAAAVPASLPEAAGEAGVDAELAATLASLAGVEAAAATVQSAPVAPAQAPAPAAAAPAAAAVTANAGAGSLDELPPELLARSRELEQELLGPAADPDEEHFQSVYQEFLATRTKCGEPAENLDFEKFAGRLRKNRDQLMAKHACRNVRFQVYVKDGKAAIKAAPVR